MKKLFIHEQTYNKKNLISLIHKNRLKHIYCVFKKYLPKTSVSWADFGCSNGYIIESILQDKHFRFHEICGFDHVEELLEHAKLKSIPNSVFKFLDLNKENEIYQIFDVVTCFETLEHVGLTKTAFKNLYNHLKEDGLLIITIPNEIGFPGLIKFIGRILVRKNPYPDFFPSIKAYLKYIINLITDKDIESFRIVGLSGYGPHLGFDFRKIQKHIEDKYIALNKMRLIDFYFTSLKMNVVIVLKKINTK